MSRVQFTQANCRWASDAWGAYAAAKEVVEDFADVGAQVYAPEYLAYELDDDTKSTGFANSRRSGF